MKASHLLIGGLAAAAGFLAWRAWRASRAEGAADVSSLAGLAPEASAPAPSSPSSGVLDLAAGTSPDAAELAQAAAAGAYTYQRIALKTLG